MASKSTHTTILDQIKQLPGYPNLTILDLSCGDAVLLSELAKDGCECTGTRYKDGDYIIKGNAVHSAVKILRDVDLDEPLPFDDKTFDLVVLQEVLEHLPCHVRIIKEAVRVIRDGGTLIFSTPNLHRLHSRANFLLTGAHKLKRRRIGWDLTPKELYAYHFNPVDFTIIHTILFQNGVRIQTLPCTKVKYKYLFYALLYPIVAFCTLLEFRTGTTRGSKSTEGERDLLCWMLKPAMLFSEQILVVGKRETTTI